MNEFERSSGLRWPERPWIMAATGAAAGLAIHLLTHGIGRLPDPSVATAARQAAGAGVFVGALGFMLVAERRRLGWAACFAIVWGLVVALVGYSTSSYNFAGELAEFPFLSALLSVIIAAPLFQTMRDEGRRSLPYDKVHSYAWTDAIIGGASLAFTGLTFLLAFLLASLFDAIGISLLRDLLRDDWFDWMLAGAAFGAASAVLRERDPLLGTLQRLVMLVFSILAPILAAFLAIYLLALPVTGFSGLWKAGLPETPLLLSAAAFCFIFINAIIGESPDERKPGRLWRVTEIVLLVAVLPLAILALVSMGMRVSQHGWTPERLWGVLACLVAVAFGLANWIAVARMRGTFDIPLRQYQKLLAIGLCGVALFLALPIVDFGAISARSQVARLQAGAVDADHFDWAAMAFDFGPAGRRALERIKAAGGRTGRLAADALSATNRYEARRERDRLARQDRARATVRILTDDVQWSDDLGRRIVESGACGTEAARCVVQRLDEKRLLLAEQVDDGPVTTRIVRLDTRLGERSADERVETAGDLPLSAQAKVDLARDPVEIRQVERRQLFVDGKPVGDPFE